MKKRIKRFFVIFLLLICTNKVYALSVSKNDIIIEKGSNDTIELYANTEVPINSVTFTLVYSTYDIPANFYVSPNFTDTNPNGIKHTINFDEVKSGKIQLGTIGINIKDNPKDLAGTISIHTASAKNMDDNVINLNNQTINVKIGEPKVEVKEIDKNLLTKIESKIVKIDIVKDKFEYTVIVDKTIEELDLKPIAKDENTIIDIKTQKISELTDNRLIINTKLNDVEQEYIINIKLKEKKEIDKSIVDKGEFKENKRYKGVWLIMIILLMAALIVNIFLNKEK